MFKGLFAAASLLIVTGCGGTTISQSIVPQQAVSAGDLPLTFNPTEQTIALRDISGILYEGAAFSDVAGKTFRQTVPVQPLSGGPTQGLTPSVFSVYAIANQPGITAISAVTNRASNERSGLILVREQSPISLPSIQQATFRGPYQGILNRTFDGRSTIIQLIGGDTVLTADLNTNRVTGQIQNREYLPNDVSPDPIPNSNLSDIRFNLPISLNSASFSGVVTGGELTSGDSTTGQTTGIFGGQDGTTLAGHIVMRHTDSPRGPAVERGAYAASRLPSANPFDPPQSDINLRANAD